MYGVLSFPINPVVFVIILETGNIAFFSTSLLLLGLFHAVSAYMGQHDLAFGNISSEPLKK